MNSLIAIPVESCIDCYPVESFILSCSPCVRPLRPLNGSIGCGQDPIECIGITIAWLLHCQFYMTGLCKVRKNSNFNGKFRKSNSIANCDC